MLVAPDPAKQRIIDAFNRRAVSVIADMAVMAPKNDGLAEPFPSLIDVCWLDLGQLLDIFDRTNAVWDAFRSLEHLTSARATSGPC